MVQQPQPEARLGGFVANPGSSVVHFGPCCWRVELPMPYFRLALIAIVGWAAFHFLIAPPAGVMETSISAEHPFSVERPLPRLETEPQQVDLDDRDRRYPAQGTDYLFSPQATFELRARVLSTRNYRLGMESRVSPRDLALGWGPMAQDEVLADIRISQSGRWYSWRARSLPIPQADINRHSSNMHMIAGNEDALRALKRVRQDDEITLRGHLVNVSDGSGGRWRTSTNRTDTGAGASEIVLIDELIIH